MLQHYLLLPWRWKENPCSNRGPRASELKDRTPVPEEVPTAQPGPRENSVEVELQQLGGGGSGTEETGYGALTSGNH